MLGVGGTTTHALIVYYMQSSVYKNVKVIIFHKPLKSFCDQIIAVHITYYIDRAFNKKMKRRVLNRF